MKKLLVLLLALTMCAGTRLATAQTGRNAPWCADGERIWAMVGDTLTVRLPETIDDYEAVAVIQGVTQLAWHGETLYACVSRDGLYKVIAYTREGVAGRGWTVSENKAVMQMCVTESFIAALAPISDNPYAMTGYELIVANKETGERTAPMDAGITSLEALIAYGGDRILVSGALNGYGHGNSEFSTRIVDLLSGEIEETTFPVFSPDACFDGVDTIYYRSDTGVVTARNTVTMETASLLVPSLLSVIGVRNGLYLAGEYCVTRNTEGVFHIAPIREEDSKTLYIVGLEGNMYNTDTLLAAGEYWSKVRPGYVISPVSYQRMDQLQTALMAQDERMDCIVYSSRTDALSYIDAGILIDLAGEPAIRDALVDIVDLEGAMYKDGSLYGAPSSFRVYAGYVTDERANFQEEWEKVGLKLPESFSSWPELMDFAKDVYIKTGHYFLTEDKRFPTVLTQCLSTSGGEPVFDTPDFREAMEALRTGFEEGYVIEYDWTENWG